MKHVLVTGGAGFIGSHLCDRLLAAGYSVTAVDNLVTGRKENLSDALKNQNFSFVLHDVCKKIDEQSIPLIKKFGLSGVFHFACPASPVDFDRIPLEILAVDSVGTMETVGLALKYKARYLLASTSEVYGDPLVNPQPETYWGNVNPIGPRSCYDETKRFAEAYVTSARRSKNLNSGIVRIFNTYGPRMRPDDGRVVPELCMQAVQNKPLTIHGDGKQTRSFCYVSDLIEGILKVYESDSSEPVNLGNPVEKTILEFAETLKKITKTNHPIKHLPAREDDPKKRCPNITKAKTMFSWNPEVSLEKGLQMTLEYFGH
jgi:dTDP-glucose 4,6-dehydratase